MEQDSNSIAFKFRGAGVTVEAQSAVIEELNNNCNSLPYFEDMDGKATAFVGPVGELLNWAPLEQATFELPSSVQQVLFENREVQGDETELSDDAKWFLSQLRQALQAQRQQARQRLTQDRFTTRDLAFGLQRGDAVLHRTDNGEMPCVVVDISVRQSMFGISYSFQLAYLAFRRNGCVSWHRTGTSFSDGSLSAKNSSLTLLTEPQRHAAAARGEQYLALAKAARYARCDGKLRVERGWNTLELPLHGRVIADPLGSHESVPSMAGQDDAFGPDYPHSALPPELYEQCRAFFPQFVAGFSFHHKTWGLLSLDELHDIDFRDQAFEQLVLDEEVKKTIYALVQHSEGSFSDIIDGKSGGSIFLLYGPPGAGKTLTAEAVAETQHRPLYMVNVGELGTTPDELEDALKAALQTAERWNAVVLLDEADIFLERRSSEDVVRNALVGIFLRELEYYRGVMFLTTNRASNLDPAILSRVSLGIRYDALSEEQRLQVWNNLTKAANGGSLPDFSLAEFAQLPLNGRQIKNVLRQALTLGKSQDCGLTRDNLHLCTQMTVRFMQDCQPKNFD